MADAHQADWRTAASREPAQAGPAGVVIGIVRLHGCELRAGIWHWLTSHERHTAHVSVRGSLGLWRVPAPVLLALGISLSPAPGGGSEKKWCRTQNNGLHQARWGCTLCLVMQRYTAKIEKVLTVVRSSQECSNHAWDMASETSGPGYPGGSEERAAKIEDIAAECDLAYDAAISALEDGNTKAALVALYVCWDLERKGGDGSDAERALAGISVAFRQAEGARWRRIRCRAL